MYLQPVREFSQWSAKDVGEPLYLTPYIEAGDIDTAKEMAMVDSSLLEVLRSNKK